MSDGPETEPLSNRTDRAVSPVVGVALLIAITVILAAVIGFVVLDTSSDTTDTSNARLDFAGLDSSTVTVTHEGGDTFDPSNVIVRVNGTNEGNLADGVASLTSFRTGSQFEISGLSTNEKITVVWDDPESDREVQIASATVE